MQLQAIKTKHKLVQFKIHTHNVPMSIGIVTAYWQNMHWMTRDVFAWRCKQMTVMAVYDAKIGCRPMRF